MLVLLVQLDKLVQPESLVLVGQVEPLELLDRLDRRRRATVGADRRRYAAAAARLARPTDLHRSR